VARQDGIQLLDIDCTLFEEHRNSSVILGSSGFQGNGNQMLGTQNGCRNAIIVGLNRFGQCLLLQGALGRQELDRPVSYYDAFAIDFAPSRREIFVDG
jgi:hypothetical protein